MQTNIAPWHLQPGNKEKQITNVMTAVKAFISGDTKKLVIGSQGFDTDGESAKVFMSIITTQLSKMGFEGHHEVHQSRTGSGKWYYQLHGVWPLGNTDIFTTFQEASAYARSNGGTIRRMGKQWKVSV